MASGSRFVALVAVTVLSLGACSNDGGPKSGTSQAATSKLSGAFGDPKAHSDTHSSNRERIAALTKGGTVPARTSPGTQSFRPCADPWVTDAVMEVTGSGSPPTGKACDPYLYGKANWNSYPELVSFVEERFAMYCKDLWITQSVMEVFDRVPQNSLDCDHTQYGGGNWSNYQDLNSKMWQFRFTDPPAPSSRWRMLFLIYQRTALPDLGITGTPLVASMDVGDVEHIKQIRRDLKKSVYALSDGAVSLSVDVVPDAGTITSLTHEGNSWWVGPRDVRSELDTYAPEGSYDSVLVFWRNDDGPSRSGPNLGGTAKAQEVGLALGRQIGTADQGYRDGSNGAGYASLTLPMDHADFGSGGAEKPHHLALHEWLHQAEHTYRDYEPLVWGKDALPDCQYDSNKDRPGLETEGFLHCAPHYGFTNPFGKGWEDWYSAAMKGQVDGRFGFWRSMWQAGPPRFLR